MHGMKTSCDIYTTSSTNVVLVFVKLPPNASKILSSFFSAFATQAMTTSYSHSIQMCISNVSIFRIGENHDVTRFSVHGKEIR